MARYVLLTCASFAAPVVGNVQCPEHLEKLTSPNCGNDDPECPLEAPFHRVNISVEGEFRYVQTSYCPPYDWSCLMNPKGRRPCARRQTFKLPLKPTVAKSEIKLGLGWPRGGPGSGGNWREFDEVTPMLGGIGVLSNGVVLNGVASKLSETLEDGHMLEGSDVWVDAADGEKWMDDDCMGHLSGGGNYHTHAGAWHSPEKRLSCGLPADEPGAHSELLGWAFDGFGIYGPVEGPDGALPMDIDTCGGHVGAAAQSGYHYHLSDSYPYALECYHGCPEPSNNFRFKGLACSSRDEAHASRSSEL